MQEHGKLAPHRISKPIQLLAAWLLGLIVVNGAFLAAASQIDKPDWVSGALVIACIVNVPLFRISIFLLQTKFRPEMQEDSFYSKYLESRTGNTERKITPEAVADIRGDIASLEKVVAERVLHGMEEAESQKIKWSSKTVMLNKTLSNFAEIWKQLSVHGIPIHETFGSGADAPTVFNVAIGIGFDVDQIRALVKALSPITDGWITFAHPDAEYYDKQVLIGAYGAFKHGIELHKIEPFIEQKDITEVELYKMLGQ